MIKLDGYDLSYFGLLLERGHSHPSPGMREKTMVIPGRPGVWDFGSELDSRPFNFPLAVIEHDRLELQRKIRSFTAFLMDSYGKPRGIKLTFDYEPDKYYLVKYAGQISPARLFGVGQFDLPVSAHDPHAQFIVPSDEIIMDSDIPIMSDLLWDTGFSNRVITSPQTFEIINNGTVVIPFSFHMEGSGNNVAFSLNGKTMTFENFVNKTLEITNNYVVKVDGISDLTISNGIFLDLLPGVNVISVSGSNLDLTISESLTYQYI